jgi:HAD superfamily hydrolase (TIGR01509 family)
MSFGYIPRVPRLRPTARRGNPWAGARWTEALDTEGQDPHGAGRRGLILNLDDTRLSLDRDAVDALHELRAAGWRLAALAHGVPPVQFRRIAALGLTSLVDEIVYAEEHVAGGKPAAAALKAALRSLELGAGQSVSVGDDPVRDVRAARALGMRTIRVSCPGILHGTAPVDEADVVIDSLRQLPGAARLLLDTVTADVA